METPARIRVVVSTGIFVVLLTAGIGLAAAGGHRDVPFPSESPSCETASPSVDPSASPSVDPCEEPSEEPSVQPSSA